MATQPASHTQVYGSVRSDAMSAPSPADAEAAKRDHDKL